MGHNTILDFLGGVAIAYGIAGALFLLAQLLSA